MQVKAVSIRWRFKAIEVLQDRPQERASITASITSELQVQADTDGLTALLNRRALDRYVQRESNHAGCLILLDIDHFKSVNDTYGHPTGDRVLTQTAELLRSLLRTGDVAARFGGEEFAILIPGNDLPGAVEIARKLRLAIQMNEKSIARVAGPAPWAARFRPNSISFSRVRSFRFTRPREVLSALSTMDFDRRTGLPTWARSSRCNAIKSEKMRGCS